MRKTAFFMLIFFLVCSCDNETDLCDGDTVLDRRIGLTPSPSYGLCIQKTCEGKENELCCSTEIIKEGKCLSGKKPGEECGVIADCEADAPICLKDPVIVNSFIKQGSEIGIELTEEMLTEALGLNYCTVMNCDPDLEKPADPQKPVACPEKMTCSDSLSGVSTGVFICQKDIEEDIEDPDEKNDSDNITADESNGTDNTITDEDKADDSDFAQAYTCMGEECTAHKDCPSDSCDATFCTGELPAFVLGDGPKVCVVRCDPNAPECPEELVCNGGVASLGEDISDGAKGICVTPDSILRGHK